MKQKSLRVALFGMLAALAATLSYLESLLPTAAFLPPGAKPGFSNIVNMFAASAMGLPAALCIALLKACFAGLTRGMTAFLMSLCGGVISTVGMYLLFRVPSVGYVGIGVCSALLHNLGQLLVSFLLVGNASVWGYLPILLVSAVVTGFVTGSLCKGILPALLKMMPVYRKKENKESTKKKGE